MMNRLLIALYKLDHAQRAVRRLRRGADPVSVTVWIDPQLAGRVDAIECALAFDGTPAWANLVACEQRIPECTDLQDARVRHLLLCDDHEATVALASDARSRGVGVFDSSLPSIGTLDYALCIEAAHHDHELGGYNAWLADGRVQFSRYVLWHLSAVHCKFHFPQHVLPELGRLAAREGRPIEALDIGCGLLSRLRWGQMRGLLRTTGVDPLLNIYRAILARHGLLGLPHITPAASFPCFAEELSADEIDGRFGFVYTSNALDHTQDPERVVTLLGAALRPDGLGVIQGAVNEGTREDWSELHQFDLRVDADRLVCMTRAGDCRILAGPDKPLRVERVHHLTDDYMSLVVRRASA